MLKTQPLDSTDPKWEDLSTMKTLTCKNHTDRRYITKNPWTRHLFYESWETAPECKCPFSDLVEII